MSWNFMLVLIPIYKSIYSYSLKYYYVETKNHI
jgi:hypothetical protein